MRDLASLFPSIRVFEQKFPFHAIRFHSKAETHSIDQGTLETIENTNLHSSPYKMWINTKFKISDGSHAAPKRKVKDLFQISS